MPIRESRRTVNRDGSVTIELHIDMAENEDHAALLSHIATELNITSNAIIPVHETDLTVADTRYFAADEAAFCTGDDIVQPTTTVYAPTTTVAGDLWYNNSDNNLYLTDTTTGTTVDTRAVEDFNHLHVCGGNAEWNYAFTGGACTYVSGPKEEPFLPVDPNCVICGDKLSHPEWINNAPNEVKDRLKKMYDGRRPLKLACCKCFDDGPLKAKGIKKIGRADEDVPGSLAEALYYGSTTLQARVDRDIVDSL